MARIYCFVRKAQGGQGPVDVAQAVDPDLVVVADEGLPRVLALPFGDQERRLVHHVPDAEHEAAAGGLEVVQGGQDLPAESGRLLVDDEHVRPEGFRRLEDQGLAQAYGLVGAHIQVEAAVTPWIRM